MGDPRSYRPSNGTEGDFFMSQWCAHCALNNLDDDFCVIQMLALTHDIDDDEYPSEWIYRNGIPICTAYLHTADANGEEPTVRCYLTPDMFEEAV